MNRIEFFERVRWAGDELAPIIAQQAATPAAVERLCSDFASTIVDMMQKETDEHGPQAVEAMLSTMLVLQAALVSAGYAALGHPDGRDAALSYYLKITMGAPAAMLMLREALS